MNQNVIVISGEKGSGKTSLANFIHGFVLKEVAGSIREFEIDDEGELITNFVDQETRQEGTAVLDVFRMDQEFAIWASRKMWPWIKGYNFADNLKDICIRIFGLSPEQCYGSNDSKNTATSIKWSDITFALPPRTVGELKKKDKMNEFLTAREFMQQFGTNICRKVQLNCWIDSCFQEVIRDQSPLALICDCRFINEVERCKELGAKVIRLTRTIEDGDVHESERDLDGYDDYDLVVDNQDMTIPEKNEYVLNAIKEWGIFEPVAQEVAQL